MRKPRPPSAVEEVEAPLTSRDDPRLRQLFGRPEVRRLSALIERMATGHKHGNQLLKLRDVLVLHLVAFYNPMIRSLRTFDVASQAEKVQEWMDLPRVCRSTHSDFLAAVNPQLLLPLLRQLRRKIPALARQSGELAQLVDRVLIFDGTYFEVPAQVAWALRGSIRVGKPAPAATVVLSGEPAPGERHPPSTDRRQRVRFARIRLNLHYCHTWGTAECVTVDGAEGTEGDAMRKHMEAGTLYVADRGPFSYRLLNDFVANACHYVLRVKKDIQFIASQERILSPQDIAHGVVSDRIGNFPGSRKFPRPGHLSREIIIVDPQKPDHPIRLVTDLLDVPAHIIGLLYQQRWQIELFFRWLKVHNHFDHMVTHSREGMVFVFYVMIIALLMHAMIRGQPANKYDILAYQLQISGMAESAGMQQALARLDRERALARARYARKKAMKKTV